MLAPKFSSRLIYRVIFLPTIYSTADMCIVSAFPFLLSRVVQRGTGWGVLLSEFYGYESVWKGETFRQEKQQNIQTKESSNYEVTIPWWAEKCEIRK